MKNKITEAQYEKAYELGVSVVSKSIGVKEGVSALKATGMNSSSARDLINNLRKMLSGALYKRGLSTLGTDLYLQYIFRDRGIEGLSRAITSLDQHIKYRNDLDHGEMNSLVKTINKYRQKLAFELPDELHWQTGAADSTYLEGGRKLVCVNIFERNSEARNRCIEKHGNRCAACKFHFEEEYGAIGANFIHVHHLKQLSEIGKEYKVNPEDDLCPVRPNCHAMLHKRSPPYTIEELRNFIMSAKSASKPQGKSSAS